MVKMKNNAKEGEEQIPESEIVKETLGYRSGYIKGLGHGVEVIRGKPANEVGGLDAGVEAKLTAELEKANANIANLTQKCAEQRESVSYMKHCMFKVFNILEKVPGIPPELFMRMFLVLYCFYLRTEYLQVILCFYEFRMCFVFVRR